MSGQDGLAGAATSLREQAKGRAVVVAEFLRCQIVAGRIKPGQRLVERGLSAQFGVSRTPVREAVRMLIGEGLVAPDKHGNSIVSDKRTFPVYLVYLSEVRAGLEAVNAFLAASRRDPQSIGNLRDIVERGKAAVRGPSARLATLSTEFHRALLLSGGNCVLHDIVWPLCLQAEAVFKHDVAADATLVWQEHCQIVEAVANGDPERAALVATSHVWRAAQTRLGIKQDLAGPPAHARAAMR